MRKADSRGEAVEKIEYYSRAIRAWGPTHAKTLLAHCHYRRGEAHFLRYELDLAEPDLVKTTQLDPRNARAYHLLGRLNMLLGRGTKAAGYFGYYNATSSREESEGYWRLGDAELMSGRKPAARKAYERAMELDPEDHRPYLGLARLQLKESAHPKALESLQTAHRLAGKADPTILALKGRAGFLARALSLAPEAVSDLTASIDLFESRMTEFERASDALGAAETRVGLAEAYHDRALIHSRLQNHPAALSDHKEACRLDLEVSCRKADALAKILAAPKKNEVIIEPAPGNTESKPPKPAPRKKKKKSGAEPEERVYIQ